MKNRGYARDIPSAVYRDQHPLRTGLPGRKYSPFDYMTPIVDAMRRTDGKVYGTGMSRLVNQEQRRRERAILERTATIDNDYTRSHADSSGDEYSNKPEFARLQDHPPNSLCNNCGTSNRTNILIGSDGRLVCKCGAECGMIMGSDYKDTHDTDKSLARADVSGSSSRLLQANMKALRSTVVPESVKRKHHMGNSAEISFRMADRDECSLSKGNQRKLTNIISNVDELLSEIGRMDEKIGRRVRMDAEFVFKESVKHHAKCRKRECQKSLFEKPAGVIARESIVYTIDQLSSIGMEGVTMQTIATLQQRVRSSSSFNQRDNATQHQSCLAMISALSTSDNSLVCPTARSEDEMRSSGGAMGKASSKIPFSRQDSDVQTTYLVQLRDAISRLCVEYACPNEIRDAAMCSMQHIKFVKQLSEGLVVPSKKSSFATAYIILRSVAEETNRSGQLKSELHLRRVGLESMDVESMVCKMRSILPKGIIGAALIEEDELY